MSNATRSFGFVHALRAKDRHALVRTGHRRQQLARRRQERIDGAYEQAAIAGFSGGAARALVYPYVSPARIRANSAPQARGGACARLHFRSGERVRD